MRLFEHLQLLRSCLSAAVLTLLLTGCRTANVMDCLQQRPLVDTEGRQLSGSVHQLRQIRVPQSCVALICSADVLVVGWQRGVQFTSISVDDSSVEGRRCMADVQRSADNYHKANFPVTFYRAGDLQLVFHDSLCPAYSLDKQRFLLKSMLTARNVQPLEAYIICDGSLQVTRPTIYALEQASARHGRQALPAQIARSASEPFALAASSSSPAYRLLTHVTMFSPALPQERSSSDDGSDATDTPFAPHYARLQLSDNVVVSVLSECVGDERKMELLNELAAAWMGGLDSCLRLVCHAQLRSLALGHYQYLLYGERRSEGIECFSALGRNSIGARVDTPLGSVRIISAGATTCEGTKFMVLEPSVAATSARLQDFLYYQAYRVHALGCPDLGVDCVQRKLAAAGESADQRGDVQPDTTRVEVAEAVALAALDASVESNNSIDDELQIAAASTLSTISTQRVFPRQCTDLLCDSRTRLVRTNFSDVGLPPEARSEHRFRVRIDNVNTKELNNVCYRALRGTPISRRLYSELGSIEADVSRLGIKLIFSLL